MAVLLMLVLLAAFGGVWLLFAALWLMFRITFWFVGGIVGMAMAGAGLLVMAVLGLVLLPVALLIALHLALPLLLMGGLVWLIVHHSRPAPVVIRR